MEKLQLTQEKYTLVDDEDYKELSKHKWHARKDLNTYYAQRRVRQPDGSWKLVLLHRLLLNCPDGLFIDHIDRDGLNNQKSNLRIVTHQENMMNMRTRKDNTTGLKNIYWHKRENKWMVLLQYKNKTYYGGDHKEQSDAIEALAKLKHSLGI